MLLYAVSVVVASGFLASALKIYFKSGGNWLPTTITAILPPLIFVPYGVFRLFRDIGATEEATGRAPANMIDNFATSLEDLLVGGAIWLLIALPVSILVVRLIQRRSKQ